VAQLSGYVA
jgi:DNA topoisomerase-2